MQQAEDFREESRALAGLVAPLADDDYALATLFKGWTIGDVIGHLHLFNHAAELSLTDEAAFDALLVPVRVAQKEGRSIIDPQLDWLAEESLEGAALGRAWAEGAERLADLYADVDPKKRLKWAGPDMSARSMITARQMETWAHGQEVFDRLGETREETDRIRNICHLGVSTFGWSHMVRGWEVPEAAPYIRLTAPSGAVWEWGEAQTDNKVEGSAIGFAQTVAQTRNVADTDVAATGDAARRWMETAQCFAGAPNDPPPRGARHIHRG